MRTAEQAAMAQLVGADPANGVDIEALMPRLEQILSEQAPIAAAVVPPRRRRPLRLAAIGATITALAVLAGTVSWPWSDDGPAAIAYGVTARPDGSVTVRIAATKPASAQALQSDLRAAGLRAVVLPIAPSGTCTAPIPATIKVDGLFKAPTFSDHDQGFIVTPSRLPAGATVVVGLGEFPGGWLMSVFATSEAPPTCLPAIQSGSTVAPSPGQTVSLAPPK